MIITEHREHFLRQHSKNCNDAQLLDNYLHYYLKYEGDNSHPVESFSDCLWYLKKLVTRNAPIDMVRLFSTKVKDGSSWKVKFHYIDQVCLVARIAEHIGMYDHAVHWAKKVLDYMEVFHLTKDRIKKDYLSDIYSHYDSCLEIFHKYKNYFDEEVYQDLNFEWEADFFSPTNHANQNFKYRIHL